jgi:mono/diheme cytochrome c family protein
VISAVFAAPRGRCSARVSLSCYCLSPRTRLAVFFALAVVVLASAGGVIASTRLQGTASIQGNVVAGKKGYRTYCGQCHALAEALAAGFGAENKFGQDGGPSFNELKVSATLCISAITELFGGHEIVLRKMNWTQIHDVSAFVEQATKKHPLVAKLTDG